jgi:hypothetical protein
MKVESTKKIREILEDPEARKQLQAALAEGGDETKIVVGDTRYELVSMSSADTRLRSNR